MQGRRGRTLSVVRPGRRHPRAVRLLIAVVICGLLALPALPSGMAPPVPPPSGTSTATTPPAIPSPPIARSHGLPGADPTGERFVDAPALALQAWRAGLPARPTGTGLSGTAVTEAATSPFPATPLPLVANGTLAGRIYDITVGRPIAGAIVQLVPVGTSVCSPGPCPSNVTDAAGTFSLSSAPGTVTVVFSAAYYISNRTWATVTSGSITPLGFLYLIHDGLVTGVLEDNSPSHSPIAGASVSATSRDQLIGTFPGAVSAANGSFSVAVPPVPTEIDITSPGNPPPFLENVTFVNLTPYATLDLGVIHLEGGVPITATLVDGATGLPIAPGVPSQITVCTRRGDFCLPPFVNRTGSNATGYGLPGAAYLKAYAIGYVANVTPIPDLPNTDQPVDVGTIELVPAAVVEISTNLTGGPPPPGPWAFQNLTVFACSLDGIELTYQISTGSALASSPCTPRGAIPASAPANQLAVGSTSLILAPPLRDVVFLGPAPPCGCSTPQFPIATNQIETLTPLFPSEYQNVTWVNASPDRVTLAGSVDLAPGTMLSGNVSLAGVAGPLDGLFEVQVCSTDEVTLCGWTVESSSLDPAAGSSGCPVSDHAFCAPAPPGPVVVTVTQIGSGAQNRTWLEVPGGCCAQDGRPTDVGWINVSAAPTGSVHGIVVAQTGGPGSATVPVPGVLVAVSVCPVGPTPLGVPASACTSGDLDPSDGTFNISASLGWDRVSVTATGYQSNWTWVDVTGANDSGVIELAPDAVLLGSVRGVGGGQVYSAEVSACPAAAILQCSEIGVTNSFGLFNGTVRGGPLPWGTYEVYASAAGFAPSWTWVNTTPGGVVRVPTIVLSPIGGGSAPRAPGPNPAAANATVGVWVDGRVADSRTGLGLPSTLVNECSVVSGGCLGSVQVTTAGGTFNVSLLLGQYYLDFSSNNYPDLRVYVNATATTDVHLGTLLMTHDPWVSGRVLIDPWESLATTVGIGVQGELLGCNAAGNVCDLAATTDSGGFFNVSVPVGVRSTLVVTGGGVGGFGSAVAGFDQRVRTLDAFGAFIALPTSGPSAMAAPIFGVLVGALTDGSTWNQSAGAASRPCGFCIVTPTALNSNLTSYFPVQVGAGGDYAAFLPSDGSATLLVGSGTSYRWANETVPGPVASGAVTSVPAIAVPHYGWLNLTVVDANGSVPLATAYVTAAVTDLANATTWVSGTLVRGDGYANLSAPLGSATVTVTGPGYFNQTFFANIHQSVAVALGTVGLLSGAPPSGLWINSSQVNTVNASPVRTVVDAKTLAAVPGARIVATTDRGVSTGSSLFTNGLGQFLFFAPSARAMTVQATTPGYDGLALYYTTNGSTQLTVPLMKLQGNGIVAGRVISEPTGAPVYAVEVEVCPFANPGCTNYAYTNATGYFWVAASYGLDTVTVVTEAYLTNTPITLNVPTDGWVWTGDVPIYEFASLHGSVRGLPSGQPIAGANVSVCSPLGNPVGPCTTYVPTDANGDFLIPFPPGSYVLQVAAAGFNTTYRPLSLQPGQDLAMGTIFLFAFGTIVGSIASAITGHPVTNASAIACATYRVGDCSPFVPADPSGAFSVFSPPGPVLLTVTAPLYFDNFSSVYVPTGGVLSVGTILLAPLSADIPESVAGSVIASDRAGAPIPGAFVSALSGNVPFASTATDSAGQFYLPVAWGTYTVVASAPGYATARTLLVVHANLTGIQFALATMTYTVSGVARDAVSRAPLVAIAITEGGTTLATTGTAGNFSFPLPNGTFALVARSTSLTGAEYTSLPFSVTVNGASAVRNLDLNPSAVAVVGEVVDAQSGLPVPGATVVAFGPGSTVVAATTVVSGTGGFRLNLAVGVYVLNVSAPGFEPASVTVTVPNGSGLLTIPLARVAVGAGLGAALPVPIVLGIVAAAIVAAVVGVVWYRRRPPPPPPLPRWTLDDLDEAGVR